MNTSIHLLAIVTLLNVSLIYAHNPNSKIEHEKITELEDRLKKIEKELSPIIKRHKLEKEAKKEKSRAYYRILSDNDFYSREELKTIELLYLQASEDWSSDKAKEITKNLKMRFPKANRTGCALLRYALTLSGNEKINQLIMINNNHKSCYFPDGVNVGAFSKLTLIIEYKKRKKTNDAEKEIEILKREYQHSIDHQQTLLTDRLEELISIFPDS